MEYTVYFQIEKWWGPGYMRIEVVDAQGQTRMKKDRPFVTISKERPDAWCGTIVITRRL